MINYNAFSHPLKLYGLAEESISEKRFWRLPEYMLQEVPSLETLGKRNAGVRLRFTTDANVFEVSMMLETEEVDPAMALPAAAGIDVYEGNGRNSRFIGFMAPATYGYKDKTVSKQFRKSPRAEVITINFPRNERVKELSVSVPEGASVAPPPPYRNEKPLLFYGSSITEGGCAPRPGASYTSLLARWLDSDYLNYGFSGSAKGETAFAHFIAQHTNISAMILDYDHNAPTPEHLAETHAPFFKLIREAQPHLPIIMLSRPDFDADPEDSRRRRSIIEQTYREAVAQGDEQVYFVDGELLFGQSGREECTIDACHPTGLGFFRMAEHLYPLLESILYP